MPPAYLVQRCFQRCEIQLAVETKPQLHVVEGVVGRELIEKPESLLRKRKWQVLARGNARNRRRCNSLSFPDDAFDFN